LKKKKDIFVCLRYYIVFFLNLFQEWERGEKENDEGSELNYDIL
jgi:hypothetical protein